jgi:hypothetical protein
MSTIDSSRFQSLKDILKTISQIPEYKLEITPLTASQIASLTNSLPPDDLAMFTEVGEVSLSYNDCLVIESYLPCPLSASPFYSFEPDSVDNFEHLLIFAHDVDGLCHGYDTRTHPFTYCAWDFHYCELWDIEDLGALAVVEKAIVSDLLSHDRLASRKTTTGNRTPSDPGPSAGREPRG